MNTKHTPGPWTVDQYDHSLVKAGTVNIAGCAGDQDQREANAALIAAAPLMHRALEAHAAWHWAESNSGSSTFHERMELANYSQWLTARALSQAAGVDDKEDFSGVPELLLGFDGARIDRASEQTAEQIVARLIVLYRYAVTTA